ncbi:MAG: thioredoxin [Christensenellaceae bacterium]|jgi:thioredoxin 1
MLEATVANFEQDILNAGKPAIIDFWAEWCGPCRMFGPIFEEVAAEMGDKVVFAKLNVDEQEELARQYKVMTIPTVMLFKDGGAVKKSVGVLNKVELKELIESVL